MNQEATVRTGLKKINWFQIGNVVPQGCVSPLSLFNLYAECILKNANLDKSQAHKLVSRLPGEISATSDMQVIPLQYRRQRGTKEPFDEGERGE